MGYHVEAVSLPPHTATTHPIGFEHDDRSIEVPNELGSLWLVVTSTEGEIAAQATFAATPSCILCDTIEVVDEHRRKGIATALYDFAELIFGGLTQPSGVLTDDAKAF